MTSSEIRQAFLDFFADKAHKIVASAPIVNKEDPSLMFTNAGMNQFKDYFLGNQTPEVRRIADTQKCLRVSGKHNDLEEVGVDSYHHTMFEMLGNWSFGDYFKEEAIAWAWELLTEVFQLPADRLYASIFEGSEAEGLEKDQEAIDFWKKWIPEERILAFGKKDNFWEMGDTGPCGPCSEIHIDLRSEEERAAVPGKNLVNADHPLVVEIWNLVFIQFNRKADGSLEELPEKHVDTGMGFERLVMAIQRKQSNYDTDVFTPFIEAIEKASGKKYTFSYATEAKVDIAMRVIADHLRAVAFAIADGQLPENTGAGYVIKRILRRAIRYYYSFLDISEPFIFQFVPLLVEQFSGTFPELKEQQQLIEEQILSEEKKFLRTLEKGLQRIDNLQPTDGQIDGETVFELFATYGFPSDLTQLIASEKGWTVDEKGFEVAMAAHKAVSKGEENVAIDDWNVVSEGEVAFVGYDYLEVEDAGLLKYRSVESSKGEQFQMVLARTPFYAESGGQAGDTGLLFFGEEKIPVLDTFKENDLIIHLVKKLPKDISVPIRAVVNRPKRKATEKNHTATHLMHAALHHILGDHALQKGQDVNDKRLRFDFSHSQQVSSEEIQQIEQLVNEKIRENIVLEEARNMPIEDAKAAGAMMLFGEKYGEQVRMITFDADYSRELCGGTHVQATGEIGLFKIIAESAVAAGIRRIEAVTASAAEELVSTELDQLHTIRQLLKAAPKDTTNAIQKVLEENKKLKREIEQLLNQQAGALKDQLTSKVEQLDGINFLAQKLPLNDSNAIKNLAYQLEKEIGNAVIVFGAVVKEKPQLLLLISKNLVESHQLNAGTMIRQLAQEIKGGGGGQAFFATAGGKDATGLDNAIEKAKNLL